jgi:hypothetical protein
MNRYPTSTPRAAFVIAAVALTALTIGASVVAPVMLNPSVQETGALTDQKLVTPASTPAIVSLGRIEVRSACEPGTSIVQVRNLQPKHNQPS